MTAGSRRNGSSKFGLFNRGSAGHHAPFGQQPGSDSATARPDLGAPAADDGYGYSDEARDATAFWRADAYRDDIAPRDDDYYAAASYTSGTVSFPAYVGGHAYANHGGQALHAAAAPPTHWWYADGGAEEDYGPYGDRAAYGDDGAFGDDGGDAARWGDAYFDRGIDDSAAADEAAGDVISGGRHGRGSRKAPGRRSEHYSGRHASRQGKTTRKRVGKVVPAAAVAATLAAGAAVYTLSGVAHPRATQLSTGPVSLGDAATVGAGHANGAASTMIKAAQAAGDGASRAAAAGKAAAGKAAAAHKAAPKATASASPAPLVAASPAPALASPAAVENNAAGEPGSSATTASATPSAPASSAASSSASASSSAPAATTMSCAETGGLLPANVTAIVSFLLANGYSDNAVAGIAGNIYQESKGNPESEGMGGGGLIGWTPLPSGFVTGNPSADLQTQLAALLTYNQGWSGYLPALNSAASPADAAYIYVTDFERAGIPAAATREQAAQDVASACGI